MSECRDCNGWGIKGESLTAVFCSCWAGKQAMNDPMRGQRLLEFYKACGKAPMVKLQKSEDKYNLAVAIRDQNWPTAPNPPRAEVSFVADVPPIDWSDL